MLDPRYSFERLVVGAANELAATAARRVAETPGSVYNPLLIYGRAGIGKTHLLHAIGMYAQLLDPDIAVHLESADGIAERVTRSLVGGDLTPLREAFGQFDLLLVDDVERLAGMERTQLELAAIASAMLAEGRQIVLASGVPPGDMPGLVPEFREVLSHGLVVDIGAPDHATRRVLTDRYLAERGIVMPDDVAQALSAFDFQDVRAIHDAIGRVLERAELIGRGPHPHDVLHVVAEEVAQESASWEFDSFVSDVSRTLAVVVEAAPWRRRIAEAILRWEGEGLRTDRLEAALDADTAPDVDALLEAYTRDATRLLQIREELRPALPLEPLDDPAELKRAESLLAAFTHARNVQAAGTGSSTPEPASGDHFILDPWFLNPEKVVLDWTDLEGRLVEEPR